MAYQRHMMRFFIVLSLYAQIVFTVEESLTTTSTDSNTPYAKLPFSADNNEPFAFNFDEELCAEPVYCLHTVEFQRRIQQWQNPSPSDCEKGKFLLYEPPSGSNGIGSMLQLIGSVFRQALCLGRRLYLMPSHFESDTMSRWKVDNCSNETSSMECYFEPLTSCSLSLQDIVDAPVSDSGYGIDVYPLRDARIVRLIGLPGYGPCSLCGDSWTNDVRFFDGLFVGELGFQGIRNKDGTIDTRTTDVIDKSMLHLWHGKSFMGNIKIFWLSQFVRYVMRPLPWFKESLKNVVNTKLRSIRCGDLDGAAYQSAEMVQCMRTYDERVCCMIQSALYIPRPYVSLHVRYGNKAIEQKLQPLQKYMNYIRKKAPHIRNIFISTETVSVIDELATNYSYYTFYLIDYQRKERIDLSTIDPDFNYSDEFIHSFVNLYVSIEADFFVGSLTSSWCTLIHQMERTRGDGGVDYLSTDYGSQYTVCF